MTSKAQALDPLPDVRGLVFLGFPLHPAGMPSNIRAEHLTKTQVPLLFIQGTRDKLAEQEQLHPMRRRLGPLATVMEIDGADHGCGVLRRDGRSVEDAIEEVLDSVAVWISAWRLGV